MGSNLSRFVVWLTVLLLAFLSVMPCIYGLADTDPKEGDRARIVQDLVDRVNDYYEHFAQRRYKDAYEMLALPYRKGGDDKREWVKSVKKYGKEATVVEWNIVEIQLGQETARVKLLVAGQPRLTDEGQPRTEEAINYWTLEGGTWYFIPGVLRTWDQASAIRVAIPPPRSRVEIKH